jgi:outer membrane protein assembly factor BamB
MKRFATLACVALLAACSSNDAVDLEPADLVDIDTNAKVKKLWSEGVGSGMGKQYTLLQPAIKGDVVYAADHEGTVVALDRNSGREQWEVELETQVSGGVGLGQGRVLIGTLSGEVIALEASTGSVQWRQQVSSEVLAPPAGNGDIVAVQTLDGKVIALNATDGEQRWRYDTVQPALTLRGTSSPLVTENTVYAGFSSGKILAIESRDGILRWDQRLAVAKGRTELDRVIDIEGSPILVDDILYAASYQGRIMALNRGTGRPIWAHEDSTYQNLSAGLGYVFLVGADDTVKAYNATSGQLMWENDQLTRRRLGASQTFGSYVAVADFEGYVHIMSQTDGAFVARRKVDGNGVSAPMASVDDVLYVLGNSGDMEALSIVE